MLKLPDHYLDLSAYHMKMSLCCACLGLWLLAVAPARAQTVPAQGTPAAEPPVKAVPQTKRKSKPERVEENTPDNPGVEPSARGGRPEQSARGSQGRSAGAGRGARGAGRGARGAGAGGGGRPAGVGRGH